MALEERGAFEPPAFLPEQSSFALRLRILRTELLRPSKLDAAEMPTLRGFDEEFGQDAVAITFRRGNPMRKQAAQIVTNKRSPVVHVSTEVPRPLGEAFEDIARANGITKAELLRRLIQALVEKMKTGR